MMDTDLKKKKAFLTKDKTEKYRCSKHISHGENSIYNKLKTNYYVNNNGVQV